MTHLLAQITNPVIDPKIGGATVQVYRSIGDYTFVVQRFYGYFIRLGLIAGSVIFVFMLLFGSVEYIMAGGEKEKAGNASKRITNALVGLTLLFSLFVIIRLVKLIFGIDLMQLNVPVITP